MVKPIAIDHHAYHNFAGYFPFAQVQAAHCTAVGGLVVDRIPVLFGPAAKYVHSQPKFLRLQCAGLAVYNPVGVNSIESHLKSTCFALPEREQSLVSVAVPGISPKNRFELGIGKAPDARQGVPHPLFLDPQLCRVADMAVAAASALGKDRAVRFGTVLGWGD